MYVLFVKVFCFTPSLLACIDPPVAQIDPRDLQNDCNRKPVLEKNPNEASNNGQSTDNAVYTGKKKKEFQVLSIERFNIFGVYEKGEKKADT